jgi:hypothetical protein
MVTEVSEGPMRTDTEVAASLGVSVTTLRRMRERKLIQSVLVSSSWRTSDAEIQRFKREHSSFTFPASQA